MPRPMEMIKRSYNAIVDNKEVTQEELLLSINLTGIDEFIKELGLSIDLKEALGNYYYLKKIIEDDEEMSSPIQEPCLVDILGIENRKEKLKLRGFLIQRLEVNEVSKEFAYGDQSNIDSLKCDVTIGVTVEPEENEATTVADIDQKDVVIQVIGELKKEGLIGNVEKSVVYKPIVPRVSPTQAETVRTMELLQTLTTIEDFTPKMEDELVQFMKEGKWWPRWLEPRIVEVTQLDSSQLAALEKPVIEKKDYEKLPREKAREIAQDIRLRIVGGLTGSITGSIKDNRTLEHLRIVFDGRNIEEYDWWDFMYAMIIRGHYEDSEVSLSERLSKLETALRSGDSMKYYKGSILKGGNVDFANQVISRLDPILRDGEDTPLEHAVHKWLLGEHKAENSSKSTFIFGREGLADDLRQKLHTYAKSLTWKIVKDEVITYAKKKDSAYRALKASGELVNIREDVLAETQQKQRRIEADKRRKAEADKNKEATVNQVSSDDQVQKSCKICGSKDHWAINKDATGYDCVDFTSNKGKYSAEQIKAAEAELKRRQEVVKNRKAKAGGGSGRPGGG